MLVSCISVEKKIRRKTRVLFNYCDRKSEAKAEAVKKSCRIRASCRMSAQN